jgi:hypothetical protein
MPVTGIALLLLPAYSFFLCCYMENKATSYDSLSICRLFATHFTAKKYHKLLHTANSSSEVSQQRYYCEWAQRLPTAWLPETCCSHAQSPSGLNAAAGCRTVQLLDRSYRSNPFLHPNPHLSRDILGREAGQMLQGCTGLKQSETTLQCNSIWPQSIQDLNITTWQLNRWQTQDKTVGSSVFYCICAKAI